MGKVEKLTKWRNAFIAIAVMILSAPIFAWSAKQVGYAEPLEAAAEKVGVLKHGYSLLKGIFPEYVVPGLNPYLSAILSGILGCLMVLFIGWGMGKILKQEGE